MDDVISKGAVISGKYRVEGVLGVGAMGIVYAAHHLLLDERVALKVLRSELVAFPDAVKRFTSEARAAAKIKNEHVTRVFDVGELADGTPYIVMESLEGEDLARRLATRGALRLEEAIAFVLQACEALVEAHILGIVHRDLKPSNLFCYRRSDGALSIKVLDFGISKIAPLAQSMSDAGRASGGKTVGSPFYMSPEQMQSSHDVDHRTDIWALGVILFELLTTKVPFEGESLPDVCIKVATRAPRSLRGLRNDVPEEVEATVLKCLQKKPEDRFENLAEFAGSLFPYAGKGARLSIERIVQVSRKARSTAIRTASESPLSARASEGATIRPLGATVPPARAESSGIPWVGLAGAAAVVLGVVVFWARPTGKGDQSRAAEPAPTAKAAAQPSSKPVRMPQKPENLPKADEAPPSDMPSGAAAVEAPSMAPVRPGAQGSVPTGSAAPAAPLDKQDRARPPAKPGAEPSSTEPGVDPRRSRPQNQPRVLDEINPYVR